MKSAYIIVLSSLLIQNISFAASFKDDTINVTFPEKVGIFALMGDEKFDDARLGYSIAYSSYLAEITIYVFDGGVKGIKNGIKGRFVQLFFDKAVADIRTYESYGIYLSVKKTAGKELFSKDTKNYFLVESFEYDIKSEENNTFDSVKSYLFCRGISGKILKIRVTGQKDIHFEKQVEEFLSKLICIMKNSNE